MKRSIVLCLLLLLILTACGGAQPASSAPATSAQETVSSEAPASEPAQEPESRPESAPAEEPSQVEEPEESEKIPEPAAGRTLIAYFSCTNNTKTVAEALHEALPDSDLFEIVPAQPYTSDDLNYNTDCRANREQGDDNARPEISGTVANWDDYDIVFLGYPIWWGVAPTVVNTFLEQYDLAGKTVVSFATSGGSGIGNTNAELAPSCPGAKVTGGKVFRPSASEEEVKAWFERLV